MQKAPNALTRKAGPFPVWAYGALALAAFLVYRYRSASTPTTPGLPYTPVASSGSAAQQPASGQGSAADNSNADLLAALGDNKLSYDALLNALQYGGGGGSGGANADVPAGFGGGGGGGADTSAVTAPTIDSGVNNAPTDPYAAAVASAQSTTPDYGLIAAELPLSGADQGYALENATLANPGTDYTALSSALGIPTMASIDAQLQAYGDSIPSPVSSPTPTPVSPAPVDTSSATVADPRPLARPGQAIAV